MKTFFRLPAAAAVLLLACRLTGAEEPPADPLAEAARNGNTAAQMKLAEAFLRGKGRKANPVLARHWFARAAKSGDPVAKYNLAVCYLDGIGGEKRPNAAFHELEPLWRTFTPARILLAELLFKGVKPEPNPQGPPYPRIPRQPEAAIALVQPLADKEPRARLLLIKIYYADAPRYAGELRQELTAYAAVPDPDPEALVLYSAVLRTGIGGPVDIDAGLRQLRRAADMDYPEARAQYGEMLLTGQAGKKDVPGGLRQLELAAAKKSPRALAALGDAALYGIGAPADLGRAFDLYSRAAATGYPPALLRQGRCYLNGFGTEPNPEQAFQCFQAAALAEDGESLYELARCYENGIGTAPNPASAEKLYQAAAAAGSRKAKRKLGLPEQTPADEEMK